MCVVRAQIFNRRSCVHRRIFMNQIVRHLQYNPKFIHLTISTRVFLFEQPSTPAEKNFENVVLRAAETIAKCRRI